jgi:hypothetical protein
LTASLTNLRRTAARSRKRPLAGNSNHHPAPATETAAARVSTTNGTPHPTLATALPTASMPDQAERPMQAAIPVHQTTTPMCFSAPIPILSFNATIGQPAMQRIGATCRGPTAGAAINFRRTWNWSDPCACRSAPHQHHPDSDLRLSYIGSWKTMRMVTKTA